MLQHTISPSIKKEIKNTLAVGGPLVASYLIYASSGFIGTAMVAQLGKDALAASILVSIVWASLSVLFFGILNAISVLVSHQHGAKNINAITEIMGQAYLFGIVISILLIMILCSMPLFLQWSDQPPVVLHLAKQYMQSLLWTIPGLIILIISEQFLAGINRAKIILRISLLVVPIEIPIIYILIFGKLGLPSFGVAGVGYGFAITYSATAICLLLFLLNSKYYAKYKIFSQIRINNFKMLKEIIRVGLPIGFMNLIEVSTLAIATFWIGHFGTTMLAAHQIVMQYLSFVITLIFSMSSAVSIRVGHAVGRQDLDGVRNAAFVGMILNFVCILLVAIAFYVCPEVFLRLDINIHDPLNRELIQNTSLLLTICGVLLLFDNFRIIGFGALRGVKDTRFPMIASFISFWLVALPLAFLFSFVLDFGGKGIWWGLSLGIASGAIIVLIRLRYILSRLNLDKLISIGKIS
jgi:MATE family multidrug resistance protein